MQRKMLDETHVRTFSIQTKADKDTGLTEIAFSSEEPYERYFGSEVLDHDPQSVRLDRLNNGAAVLVNHDTNDQVGVVATGTARVDADKRGRAAVRFSRSARGREIEQDVEDEIRTLVSVGYRINKYEVMEREGQSDLVRVTDWQPYEISLVAIPADATVGVGRSAEQHTKTVTGQKPEITLERVKEIIMDKVEETKQETPEFDVVAERTKIRTEETKRTNSIRAMADTHKLDDLGRQGVDEGWTAAEFNTKALEEVGKRNNKVRSESPYDGEVDLSNKERSGFSMIKLMDAISNPNDRAAQSRAGLELEVSAESQRSFGSDFACRGEFVPDSLLGGQRTLSAGTATDGAELVANNLLSGSYIDVLRNASSVTQAGMTILSGLVGTVDIPRQTSGAASGWISAEDGDAPGGEPQFDQVSLAPKDLACHTQVTRRLLQQSTPGIEGIVVSDLAKAQALGIDLAALYGTGSSGQPKGISLQTGINVLDLAAAKPTYVELVNMVAQVMADNAITGNPRWIIEANGWEALSTTPKQGSGVEGNFILNDSGKIVGYSHINSNQVTDEHYFFGDFSQLLMGEWGGLEMNVDPYTNALKGRIAYITFKTVDIAVRQPTAFCHAHDGIA
jgi:HK97 family phage major capsid protein/HK97 family phage prohead protease